MRKPVTFLLAALVPLVLASCVTSKNPLSDEKTSSVDRHLIGTWHQQETDGSPYSMTIGRKPATSNVMEWVSLSHNKRQEVQVKRHDVFAKPGRTKYISITLEADNHLIGKYTSPDANTFELHLLDKWVVGKAVEDGKLKGVARRNNDGEYTTVSLSDPPEKIIEYLEKNADTCFAREPIVYKKSGVADK